MEDQHDSHLKGVPSTSANICPSPAGREGVDAPRLGVRKMMAMDHLEEVCAESMKNRGRR